MLKRNTRHHIQIKQLLSTGEKVCNEIRIKTRPGFWLNTPHKVIIPISIHSALYIDKMAKVKLEALFKVVKENVQGEIILLMCEGSHLHTLSLKYENDLDKALKICTKEAKILIKKFELDKQGLSILHWDEFIKNDEDYFEFESKIYSLKESNIAFDQILRKCAEENYTLSRMKDYPNKELYINKAMRDLIEDCIYVLIAAKKGYRFEFYPGKREESSEFINKECLDGEQKFDNINVTLGTPKLLI